MMCNIKVYYSRHKVNGYIVFWRLLVVVSQIVDIGIGAVLQKS